MFVDTFVVTVTTGGARGDTKCVVVVTGEAGEAADARMEDSGGGAGATKAVRVAISVLEPINYFLIKNKLKRSNSATVNECK